MGESYSSVDDTWAADYLSSYLKTRPRPDQLRGTIGKQIYGDSYEDLEFVTWLDPTLTQALVDGVLARAEAKDSGQGSSNLGWSPIHRIAPKPSSMEPAWIRWVLTSTITGSRSTGALAK